jgi:hypothetical protein
MDMPVVYYFLSPVSKISHDENIKARKAPVSAREVKDYRRTRMFHEPFFMPADLPLLLFNRLETSAILRVC